MLPNQYPMYPMPQQQMRTAWTDLKVERESLTDGERTFVMNDPDYQKSHAELNDAFYGFLQHMLGNDFINAGNHGFVEKALLDLKTARRQYQKENDGVLNDPEVQALIEKKRRAKNGNRNSNA